MDRRVLTLLAVATALALALPQRISRAAEAPVSTAIHFNHDIRPILSENCLLCHGPDHTGRKADLRLDQAENAYAAHDTGTPIVPGKVDRSEVIKRITSSDPDEHMPPPKSGKKLSPKQIELIRQWIAQGAKYEKHWAFIPPTRPELPAVSDAKWCRNPIDRFVLARLESEGLKPSPEADRATLIRRLYFDLTGLPPTLKEIDDFLNDKSPDAYEKVVDRLLANPHYGERMALDWLDAARYADTHGYHIDSGRDQTAWREWVINAFNSDMPFDQFTVDQLAGDLLPHPTTAQRVATGFVRNNMVNFEGGAIPEEYLTAYIIDRVDTVSTVFLGLTMRCCQCHDHKYDPFTQKDFYQLYAYFNHVPENGLDGQKGNAAPFISTPTAAQQLKIDQLASSVRQLKEKLAEPMPEVDAAQAKWELTAAEQTPAKWIELDPKEMTSQGGSKLSLRTNHEIVVAGKTPETDVYTLHLHSDLKKITAVRLEALPDKRLAGEGPGRSINGNVVLTDVRASRKSSADADEAEALPFKSAWADFSQENFPISNAIDNDPKSGWAIFPEVGKPHWAVFAFDHPIESDGGTDLTLTLSFKSHFAKHQLGKFRISVTDSAHPSQVDSIPDSIRKVLANASGQRSAEQSADLRLYYRQHVSQATRKFAQELEEVSAERDHAEATARTTMVMEEMARPRPTFILLRGQYDKHGPEVTPHVLENLEPLPSGAPANRLGLAEWIVSPKNPLLARVTVNRFWQKVFGNGIVKTPADFGTQGDPPTHPELLDWLATEFMHPTSPHAHAWDVKAMMKLIVTSATYRQSSAVSPQLLARDPENQLLARGPRFRLCAEFIRDQALADSGLLNDKIGGESVFPYQPKGLWEELMSRSDGAKWTAQVYVQDHGDKLYRRTMYTFWKRTSPPPTLMILDAPDRETCVVRRVRTNTPLQALVLMNDPTYVEASRKMAERMMTEISGGPDEKIAFAFRLATSRSPKENEIAVLRGIYQRQLSVYQKDPEAADKLLHVGESPINEKLDRADLAAWTMVASTIFNLDETLTKN